MTTNSSSLNKTEAEKVNGDSLLVKSHQAKLIGLYVATTMASSITNLLSHYAYNNNHTYLGFTLREISSLVLRSTDILNKLESNKRFINIEADIHEIRKQMTSEKPKSTRPRLVIA
jgi:hypothetical protein